MVQLKRPPSGESDLFGWDTRCLGVIHTVLQAMEFSNLRLAMPQKNRVIPVLMTRLPPLAFPPKNVIIL